MGPMLMPMPMLISFTMATMVLAGTMGTTATLMPTGVVRRGKPQPPLRPTLTMATATAIIPTMAMATGEERRGRRKLTPVPTLSQSPIQTLRQMLTTATMVTGAGILLTTGTLGHTTTDTTGAKQKRPLGLSQKVDC